MCPLNDGLTPAQIERRHDLYRHCEAVYLAEIAELIKPQQARDNLPIAARTEVVITANLREWRVILRQRLAPEAHPRMRQVAGLLLVRLSAPAPAVFEDFGCPEVDGAGNSWAE